MLCNVCREGLQGIWDPSRTKRVCRVQEFDGAGGEVSPEDSKFVRDETYKTAEPHDPEFRRPEHYMFGHHLTRESFDQSVRDGCVMCHSFKPCHDSDEAKANLKIAGFGYYSLFSVAFHDCPTMYMYVNDSRGGFELGRHLGKQPSRLEMLDSVWADERLAPDDNMNLNISSSTGDDTTWTIIQAWLDKCVETHHRCNERASATFVPTRLLRLETAIGPEPVFRIVHASEVEPGVRYATLSHCCGAEDDALQLTEATLPRLSQPQSVSILPLTFRDALVVISRLGLTHLWIDRLCILQDNRSDERVEAAKKRDVFRNAFLGIAASATTSHAAGLFSTRDPALVAPTVFDFPVNAAGATIPHYCSLEVPFGWMHAFRNDPLSQSARVVQERLLAPRMLHFGRSMVFWECYGATCAEIHPRGVNEALARFSGSDEDSKEWAGGEVSQRRKPWKTLLNAPEWRMRPDPVQQVFADWFIMLETIAGCAQTAPEERLLALTDLAGDMKSILRERRYEETDYLAGMWKAMLPGGLVWNMRKPGSRPAAYRAPTWSWASVDGGVNFHDRTPEEAAEGLLCQLVSAVTTPRTADEAGEVAAGSVVLRGKLALGKLHLAPGSGTVLIKSLVGAEGGRSATEPGPDSPSGYNRQWTVSFDTKEDEGDEILCLPIRRKMLGDIGCYVDGLALSRRDDGCYVRRGKWGILVDTEEEALAIFKGLPDREVEIV